MKKVILSIVLIIALLIGGLIIYDHLPIYMKDEAIFKGYSDYDGREFVGIDADIYYVFHYSEEDIEKFAESDLYKEVNYAKDMTQLKDVVKDFESYSYDFEPFSHLISTGDYYKLRIFGYVSRYQYNFELYFFDTDTQKLYYLYQTM
ncbi:MAG: hypothetical protein K2I73_02420 [Eubacterium sp.]|nr:hypothetical protein [Eubacterium sp.]